MKKHLIFLLLLLNALFCATPASAARIKVYVGKVTVTGAQGVELQGALPVLLASRLSGERIIAVESPAGADLTVIGSYIAFGKVYSLDAAAIDRTGKVLARAFEQGENAAQLIPSVGKLAEKLSDLIVKAYAPPTAPVSAAAIPAPQPSPPADIVRKEAVPPAAAEIIRPQPVEESAVTGWTSQKLPGGLIGIAPGKILEDGRRELYVIDDHALRLYRQDKELKLVAEVGFGPNDYLLGVDTADLDGDGEPEAYVTIMSSGELSSQVWTARHDTLKRIADGLPYFLRGIALAGGDTRIYAQGMGRDSDVHGEAYGRRSTDFYGDVFELIKTGDKYEPRNPIKLPLSGYLYNFNMFKDAQGKSHFVVINDDGYLVVFSAEGEELWRSGDKYGGSELYFRREDQAYVRLTGDPYRWIFLEQRIFVTRGGDVIVPRNEGTFVIGKNRAYNKSSVYAFAWNGSSLEERWRTRETQNYLADYFYDAGRRELVLLQVVKKEGAFAKGASTVSVKKVE